MCEAPWAGYARGDEEASASSPFIFTPPDAARRFLPVLPGTQVRNSSSSTTREFEPEPSRDSTNLPWKSLTREDIKKVYDGLEDGLILNRRGKPFEDRASYYSKVFKSKPFRLAGKDDLVRSIIEFHTVREREVRYVTEETFKAMVSVLASPRHLLLFWLHWDIGENIDTLLRLTKRDFVRQKNPDTGEAEYLLNLPREKIKRTRQTRSEPTLYVETVRYADMVLNGLGKDDPIFPFGYRQALKLMHAAVKKSGARCMPNGEPVRWKDLRSGMACHLLRSGWSRDEVNARLGHRPSSDTLDAYINYLALDRHRPKKKLHTVRLAGRSYRSRPRRTPSWQSDRDSSSSSQTRETASPGA